MISGTVIGLRALELSDLGQLQIWRNNAGMRRYYREYRELSLYDQESWYKLICCGNRDFYMFGVISLNDYQANITPEISRTNICAGQLIGVCGLTNINWIIRSAELSFYIGHDSLYVDALFAADIVNTLYRYAFYTLNMHKVWAEIYDYDLDKRKLFEKSGMRRDAVLRDNVFEDGKYYDSIIYSLIINEYS